MCNLPEDLRLYAQRLKDETWRGKTPSYQEIMRRAGDRIEQLKEECDEAGQIMEEIVTTIANGLKVDPESAFNPDSSIEGMAIEAAQVAASIFDQISIHFDDESGEFTIPAAGDEWKSCAVDIPEYGKPVLVRLANGMMRTARRYYGGNFDYEVSGMKGLQQPSNWMNLPAQPPQGRES